MTDEFSQNFGKNVNRLRTENGLTQEQLAERADMSRRFLQEVEKGEKIPTVKIAARLRRALKCTWDDLLKGCPDI
ncbi:XRE family transcriptional regulator [Spartobacteria bacterium LR76]|nr:XRE family transcriptional regulator [Spartobacteria bacterium LR76]